jgi:hypothetical protein
MRFRLGSSSALGLERPSPLGGLLAGKAAGAAQSGLMLRSPSASQKVPCAARSCGPPQNSLRSLRSLRSDTCGESVVEAREYARGHKPCAARRRTNRPACAAPTALPAPVGLLGQGGPAPAVRVFAASNPHSAAGKATGGVRSGRFVRRRGTQGLWPRAAGAPRPLTRRRCLNAVSAANEVSSAAGHKTEYRRAPLRDSAEASAV